MLANIYTNEDWRDTLVSDDGDPIPEMTLADLPAWVDAYRRVMESATGEPWILGRRAPGRRLGRAESVR